MGKSVNINLGVRSDNQKQYRNQLIKEHYMSVFDASKSNKAQQKMKKYLNRKYGHHILKSVNMLDMQAAKCEIETYDRQLKCKMGPAPVTRNEKNMMK